MELLPCPFCGSPGIAEKPPKGMRGYAVLIGCSNKECRLGSVAFDNDEEWNQRAGFQQAITEAVDAAVAQERERYASKFRGAEVVAYVIRKPGHKMSLAWEGEASVAIAREAGAVIEPLCSPQAVAELSENKSE